MTVYGVIAVVLAFPLFGLLALWVYVRRSLRNWDLPPHRMMPRPPVHVDE